jgi:hypothetical protein
MGKPFEALDYRMKNNKMNFEIIALNDKLARGGDYSQETAIVTSKIMLLIIKAYENNGETFEGLDDIKEISGKLATYTVDMDGMNTSSRKNVVLMNIDVQRQSGKYLQSGWIVASIENP